MSQHSHLVNEYRPSIGESLTYPIQSTMPNVENWNLLSEGEIVPTDKTLWAAAMGNEELTKEEYAEAYALYMANFVKEYGRFKRPFQRATMMVLPTKWDTGYSDSTSSALTALAFKQGEATKIKDSIGVVNNTISRLEGLLYETQNTLKAKRRLRANRAYADLAEREAPEELATLNSDILALEGLELGYGEQLAQLRLDARVLNQELTRILDDYKQTADKLGIEDNFEKELRKATAKGGTRGLITGGLGGFMVAGGLLFLIAQARRSPQRVRSTARGADGLFFRAP